MCIIFLREPPRYEMWSTFITAFGISLVCLSERPRFNLPPMEQNVGAADVLNVGPEEVA